MSVTCAVLLAFVLPAAVLTVWSRDTMLDTDEFVATVAPLAGDADVQEAVSFRVTEAVAAAADFEKIAQDALPPDARVLAGPIAAGASVLVNEVVSGIVATDAFAEFWEGAVGAAHENLVPLLKGEGGDLVSTNDGRIALQFGSLAQDAVGIVDEQLGTELADELSIEELEAEVVLIESQELADIQTAVNWLDGLSWLTVILAVVLSVGAVVFAADRRLGVRRLGQAVGVSMVVVLVVYSLVRQQYLDGLPDTVHNPDAAAAIFDILTRYLLRAGRALLAIAALLLLCAWVLGPSATAMRARGAWDRLVGRATAETGGHTTGPVAGFIADHERTWQISIGVTGVLALVLWTHPTGTVVILVALVAALAIGAIRLLAESHRRTQTAPDEPLTT